MVYLSYRKVSPNVIACDRICATQSPHRMRHSTNVAAVFNVSDTGLLAAD
jgi:hypothetical protein